MSDAATTIGVIGAGNMASAMVEGWMRAEPERAARILVTDRLLGPRARLAAERGVVHAASNASSPTARTSCCSASSPSTSSA